MARGRGRPKGEPTKVVRLPVGWADVARKVLTRGTGLGDVQAFADVAARTATAVPLVVSSVPAGFPSPADDYLDSPLDFNELLIENPAATFAVRVAGDSMTGAGLFPGDIAVVNRARTPADGQVVLALIDGGFTLKRYRCRNGRVWLQAENPAYADIDIPEGQTLEIWGVVTRAIRML